MDELIYHIWLSLACTPDLATFPSLIKEFSSPLEIYNATDREIRSAVGANAADCKQLIDKNLDRATEIYNFCKKKHVGILSYYDEAFPQQLREIPTPPVLLYYRGKLPNFNKGFRCAIVGTRALSDYGRINAFHLGYDMGMAGATVVSGMAIGIDGVALAGALAAGATTIAVIGSGIDVCYPAVHQTLAREIVKEGCVFTEYAPGTRPEKINFPRRNRIISGLSHTTVVVEGRESSGSLITARHAKKQGRIVFAFPGNVGHEGSQVTNLLIKNGAKLCTGADDIVREFDGKYGTALNPFKLPVKRTVNMNKVLTEYRVSALTSSDMVIRPKYNGPSQRVSSNVHAGTEVVNAPAPMQGATVTEAASVSGAAPLPAFDRDTIRIYQKIPLDCECPIEALTDEKTNLRDVMKILLKLELASFVVMLPGEKVKRKLR